MAGKKRRDESTNLFEGVNNAHSGIVGGITFNSGVVSGRDGVTFNTIGERGLRPHSLPRDSAHFVGREHELDAIARALTDTDGGGFVVVSGMGGVGKTSLALRAAHLLWDRFPDGQMFASLEGGGPQGREPGEILEDLLIQLGVQSAMIPPDLDTRAALYRSALFDRRILVVLDGAVDARQVRPLIPGSQKSAVLITSRQVLSSLGSTRLVHIAPLTTDEAVELLLQVSGRDPGELDALRGIADRCGNLPLALGLIAARLRQHPTQTAAHALADLDDAVRGLDGFAYYDSSVRSVFDLSYAHLEPPLAAAFRLCSTIPGASFDTETAAVALEISARDARRLLHELTRRHLVEERAVGRWRYHDLLRGYAQSLAAADEESVLHEVLARVRDRYLERVSAAVPALTSSDSQQLALIDRAAAVEWLEAERSNAPALAAQAAEAGDGRFVWRLADALYPFHRLRRHWADCQSLHELALAVARDAGDDLASARILNNLGVAYSEQYRPEESTACLEQALMLARLAHAEEAQSLALMNLATVHLAAREVDEALVCLTSARALAEELGDESLVAVIVENQADAYWACDRGPEAIDAYQKSLAIYRKIADLRGESSVLMGLGSALSASRRNREALDCLSASLNIARAIADGAGEARALRALGLATAAAGDTTAAQTALAQSATIAAQVADKATLHLVTMDLGRLSLGDREFAHARGHFLEASETASQMRQPHLQAESLAALAETELAAGDADSALRAWLRAIDLLWAASDMAGVARAALGAATASASLADLEEAALRYEEAAAIARDLRDTELERRALTELAGTLEELGRPEEAEAVRRAAAPAAGAGREEGF